MSDRVRPTTILLGTVLVSAGTNAYMISPASVVPLLVETFAIQKTGAGTAISAAILGSVAVQLPSGYLMDRYDNRRLVLAGVVVFVAAAAAGGLAPSFPAFLVTRFVGGVTIGVTFTVSAKVVGGVFPAARRGVATSAFVASAPAGFALAQFTSPLIALRFGWPAAFLAYAGVSVLGYLLFRAAAPEPIHSGERLSLGEFLVAVRNPPVVLVAVSAFCAYALYLFLNSWMPTYANEVLSISLAGAGAVTALVPVTGMLARPGGGWLSDRVGDRRVVIVASLLFVPPLLFAISAARSASLYALLLLLAGFTAQLSTGVYYAYTHELAPADATGTSLTVFTTLAFTGSLVAPVLGGWLVETFSWLAAFATFTGIALVGIVAVLAVPWTAAASGIPAGD